MNKSFCDDAFLHINKVNEGGKLWDTHKLDYPVRTRMKRTARRGGAVRGELQERNKRKYTNIYILEGESKRSWEFRSTPEHPLSLFWTHPINFYFYFILLSEKYNHWFFPAGLYASLKKNNQRITAQHHLWLLKLLRTTALEALGCAQQKTGFYLKI